MGSVGLGGRRVIVTHTIRTANSFTENNLRGCRDFRDGPSSPRTVKTMNKKTVVLIVGCGPLPLSWLQAEIRHRLVLGGDEQQTVRHTLKR